MKSSQYHISFFIILAVLIHSFFYSRAFTDPFILPKLYAAFFFLSILLLIIGFHYLGRKYKTSYRFSRLDGAVLVYGIYHMIRALLTPEMPILSDNFLILQLSLILYFLIKPWVQIKEGDKQGRFVILITLLLLFIAQTGYGLLQYIDLLPRLQTEFKIGGTYGNPGPYGNLLISLFPFALAFFIQSYITKSRYKILAWIALALCLVVLPLTKARTTWIAFIISTLYLLYMQLNLRPFISKWFRPLWLKLIAVLILVFVISIASVYLYKFKEESSSGRVFIWKTTLEMIKDKPLLGHGFDQYLAIHNNYQADYFEKGDFSEDEAERADSISYAFNDYLQMASEIGIAGLALFLLMVVLAFFPNRNTDQSDSDKLILYAGRAALIAFLIASLFSYPLKTLPNSIYLFYLLALISANGSASLKTLKINPLYRKVGSSILILVLIIFLIDQFGKYKAAKEWTKAFQLVREKEYKPAHEKYAQLYTKLQHNPHFLFNYGAELSVMGDYALSVKILREAEFQLNDVDVYIYLGNSYAGIGKYNEAIDCFYKAAYMMPVKFYPLYRIVKIYLAQGEQEKAILLAKEILEKEVKIPSVTVDNIRKEMEEWVNYYELQDK